MFNPIYFNVGKYVVRVAVPENPISMLLAGVFGFLFTIDIMRGNLIGALLMFIFCAIHFLDARRR